MSFGHLLYHQNHNHLELNGILLRSGEWVEIRVLGHWLVGQLHKDVAGWYLTTLDQIGIRLQSGLAARFPEASSSPAPLSKEYPKLPAEEERKLMLLVEDDEMHASMLNQLFRQETPYRVHYTSDSQAAWNFLQHIKPNLLVLDYLLPRMNGLALYDRIRADEALHTIPVLMISAALPNDEIKQRGGLIGLQKPFEIDEFLHAIEVLTHPCTR